MPTTGSRQMRWPTNPQSQSCRESFSASPDRCPEDVPVVPMIVAELELGNIEGHVLAADLVERAKMPRLKMLDHADT